MVTVCASGGFLWWQSYDVASQNTGLAQSMPNADQCWSISDRCHYFDRHWSALGIDRSSLENIVHFQPWSQFFLLYPLLFGVMISDIVITGDRRNSLHIIFKMVPINWLVQHILHGHDITVCRAVMEIALHDLRWNRSVKLSGNQVEIDVMSQAILISLL